MTTPATVWEPPPVPGGRLRLVVVRETPPEDDGSIRTWRDAVSIFRALLGLPDGRERMVALYLDTKHRLIGHYTVSLGTLDASLVHPREVFRPAVTIGAAAVVLGHNHPSADCAPSPEDASITRRLAEAGQVLGIKVLDHIILSDHSPEAYSFDDAGIMP